MEQFCDPRHFLDLSDHIRPISMQGRNAKEMDGKMEMACKEMNEQKIFALARIVRRTQLSFKEKEQKSSFLLQEFASFQNSLPKRRMQGFVSLESVTGIKSAYSQNECTQFPAFQENFLEINKLFLAVTQPSWR